MSTSPLTLAILGGGGKAGRPLLREALAAGYRVRALLRHPEMLDFSHEYLETISGDARDSVALRVLLRGCDAVLSTLGHPKGEREPILGAVTAQLLAAMREADVHRCLVVTSLYDIDWEQSDLATRQAAAFMEEHFPTFMADRRREYQLLRESDLDWTYVRIPYLVPGLATGRVDVSLEHLPGTQVAADALARFLVEQVTSRAYVRQAPFVSNSIS